MAHRIAGIAILLLLYGTAAAQQPTLLPSPAGQSPAQPAPVQTPLGRTFCDQNVTAQPADPASLSEPYRPFAGIFSDADWTPQICAALIVEKITDDGTATITYVFGPMTSGGKPPGGVLHGTGIIKNGSLLFQNSDGSQYVFKPYYTDLDGHWTTPKGETYQAIFKRAF